MKALVADRAGGLEVLRFAEVREPEPLAGDLLVEVHAAGVNPADWKIVERGFEGWTFPKTIGLDAAGTVVDLGSGVEGFARGDRVYWHGSFARLGAFAERVAVPAHVVAKLPDTVSFAAAAALPTAGFTAYQVVEERFRLDADSVLLVHAGAGGLGGFAIQLAKRRGATVITTCSPANFAAVRRIGADHALDYRADDLETRVRALTAGRGADAILDAVGPAVGAAALRMLAFQGYLACCVGLPDLAKVGPLPRGVQIADIALGWAYVAGDRRAQARLAHYGRELAALVATRQVDPRIAERVPFEGAIDALRRSRSGRQSGKLVVCMGR